MPADQRVAEHRHNGLVPSTGLRHQALVFSSDQEFLAGALPLLATGLASGEPVVAVTSKAHAAMLRRALGPRGTAVEFADRGDWLVVPGWTLGALDRYLRQDRPVGHRVRVLAEPRWDTSDAVLTAEWQRLESVLNVAFAGASVSLLCAYDTRALPAGVVAEAEATHPLLTSNGTAVVSTGFVSPGAYAAPGSPPLPPPAADAEALPFDVTALGSVRRSAQRWAEREGLSEVQCRDLLIGVHEIVSNAVEHGGGHGTAHLWATAETLYVEVSSPGPMQRGFPGYLPPDLGQSRGRGLWMARQTCTEVAVESATDGTRVRLGFARKLTAPGSG